MIYDNIYNNLDEDQKNTISNGFNSMLDLSNERKAPNTQKSLFTSSEWEDLKKKYQPVINWKALESDINEKLDIIKKIVEDDSIKKAYNKSLQFQQRFSFTNDEMPFMVYSRLLRIIYYNPDWLELTDSEMSEGDYVVKVWGGIIEDIFRDDQIAIKWGETVSTYSTDVKNTNSDGNKRKKIGDKVDFRIVMKRFNVDLLNGEIASNTASSKYFHDNRKLLRETKNIGDQFYRSKFLSNTKKMKVKVKSIQIAGTEGEIAEVSLVDNGLYINNRLGSLRLPSGGYNIDEARSLICRLLDVKRCVLSLARMYRYIEKEKDASENGMHVQKKLKRSPPYENWTHDEDEKRNEEVTSWVRGSWYNPPATDHSRFDGTFPSFFVSPPPPL